jgi:hypothetical protein
MDDTEHTPFPVIHTMEQFLCMTHSRDSHTEFNTKNNAKENGILTFIWPSKIRQNLSYSFAETATYPSPFLFLAHISFLLVCITC